MKKSVLTHIIIVLVLALVVMSNIPGADEAMTKREIENLWVFFTLFSIGGMICHHFSD